MSYFPLNQLSSSNNINSTDQNSFVFSAYLYIMKNITNKNNNKMNTKTSQDVASNPYAAPKSSVISPITDHIKYDGKLLCVTHPEALPKFCIKCGKTCSEKQKTKKLAWANPWWALSFFLIGILYAVIYMLVAKRLTVSYSLCAEHKAKEKKKTILMWSGFSVSVVLIIFGSFLNNQGQSISSLLLIAGILLFALLLLLSVFLSRVIIIKKAKYNKQVQSKRPYVFFLGGIDKSFVEKANIDSILVQRPQKRKVVDTKQVQYQ